MRVRFGTTLSVVVGLEPQRSLDGRQVCEEFVDAFGQERVHEKVCNRRLEQWRAESAFDRRPMGVVEDSKAAPRRVIVKSRPEELDILILTELVGIGGQNVPIQCVGRAGRFRRGDDAAGLVHHGSFERLRARGRELVITE